VAELLSSLRDGGEGTGDPRVKRLCKVFLGGEAALDCAAFGGAWDPTGPPPHRPSDYRRFFFFGGGGGGLMAATSAGVATCGGGTMRWITYCWPIVQVFVVIQ